MNSEAANTQDTVPQGKARSCRNGAGGEIHVDVFDNFDELAPIQQEWDNFVESVGAEIFLTYDWCRVWWKYYGKNRSLRIFVFRYEGALVGIIPLFLEKIWLGPISVRVVKIVGSDFTIAQFSLPIHNKHIKEVIQKFYELVSSEHNWDIIHIGPIAGLYATCGELKDTFSEFFGNSNYVSIANKSVQTYFELSSSWDEQVSKLRKKEREKFRRNYRKIKSGNLSLSSCFSTEKDFEDVFRDFVEMHQYHWQKLDRGGHFCDWPDAICFHREVAEAQLKHNRLRLFKVSLCNLPVGYQYGYKFGDKYFSLLGARSDDSNLSQFSLGKILFAEQSKHAIAENAQYIDSMQGRYEHKLRFGGQLFPVKSIYIYPVRLGMLLRLFIFRALARLLDVCYYKIWFCRIAPILPFKRKALWKIWIRTRSFA